MGPKIGKNVLLVLSHLAPKAPNAPSEHSPRSNCKESQDYMASSRVDRANCRAERPNAEDSHQDPLPGPQLGKMALQDSLDHGFDRDRVCKCYPSEDCGDYINTRATGCEWSDNLGMLGVGTAHAKVSKLRSSHLNTE